MENTTRDFIIPITPDYDCYDYFEARNPKRLKKLKELHNNQKYLEFEDLIRPDYNKEIKTSKIEVIKNKIRIDYSMIMEGETLSSHKLSLLFN